MANVDPAKQRVARAYNLASDSYDAPPMGFWQQFGSQLVELAAVKSGDRVLDLCCGSGASALAAARRVGPTGYVLGIDLADRLLDLARAKAQYETIAWAEFRSGDAEQTALAPESFDVGLCAFAVFFFQDMTTPVRIIHEAVRPGGTVGIAVWGEGFWEPHNTLFDERIRRHRPDLYKSFQAWYRIKRAADVEDLLQAAGLVDVNVYTERSTHQVVGAEGWWQVMRGSGYRETLSQLTATELRAVHDEHLAELANLVDEDGILSLATPVHIGIGRVSRAVKAPTEVAHRCHDRP